jgi:hypothetical protein
LPGALHGWGAGEVLQPQLRKAIPEFHPEFVASTAPPRNRRHRFTRPIKSRTSRGDRRARIARASYELQPRL